MPVLFLISMHLNTETRGEKDDHAQHDPRWNEAFVCLIHG